MLACMPCKMLNIKAARVKLVFVILSKDGGEAGMLK